MSDAPFVLVAVAAVVLAAAALLLRSRRRGGPMLTPGRAPELKGSLEASAGGRADYMAAGREALELLEAGRRAEAVALVRGRTGLGAREADEAVARLEKLLKRLGT